MRYKGRFVTKKQYEKFMKQKKTGERNVKRKTDNDKLSHYPVEGHRILNLKFIAEQLVCPICCEDISIRNLEKEVRYGLSSILFLRCQHCLYVKKVHSGSKHRNRKGYWVYDTNSLSGLGKIVFYGKVKKVLKKIKFISPSFSGRIGFDECL